ncbi:unnamed protein product [Penicillium discolor]
MYPEMHHVDALDSASSSSYHHLRWRLFTRPANRPAHKRSIHKRTSPTSLSTVASKCRVLTLVTGHRLTIRPSTWSVPLCFDMHHSDSLHRMHHTFIRFVRGKLSSNSSNNNFSLAKPKLLKLVPTLTESFNFVSWLTHVNYTSDNVIYDVNPTLKSGNAPDNDKSPGVVTNLAIIPTTANTITINPMTSYNNLLTT